MFRERLLAFDLGVVNRDRRCFNFGEGEGMQRRDQELWNMADETGVKKAQFK